MAFYLCPNCNQIYWRENLNTSPICPHCRNQVLEPINGRFILRCRQCGLTQSKNALEALDGEDPLHCQSPTCSGSLKVINLGKNRTFNKQKAEDRQHPPVPKRRILHHVKHGNSQNQQTGAIPSNNLQKALRNNLQRNIQNQEFKPFPQNQANLKASIANLNKQKIEEPVSSIKVKDHPGLQENDCLELDGEFYEITAKIGTGGMGSVWKARNHKTKKMVAVKEFYYTRFHDPDSGENFCEKYWNREKKITEMQSHSSESCLHYIGALKLTQFSISEYYIIIEYIGGEMLDVWYNKRYNDLSKLDVKELRMIIKDILMPLTRHMHYVHNIISSNGKGIVHRDLTVQNVMIVKKRYQEEFTPIIIDWGVAKEVTQMYNPKKPYYVSSTPEATGIRNRGTPPEVMAGFEPMAATDIYMLGHIMFYLFSGGHYASAAATNEDFVLHPGDFNPDLPSDFNRLVEYMTQYEPADRMESMAKVYEALQWLYNASAKKSHPTEEKRKKFYLYCEYNEGYIPLQENQVISIGRDEIISTGNNHEMDGHLYNALVPTENDQYSFQLYIDSGYIYIRDRYSKLGTFISNLTSTNQQVYNNIPIKGLDNVCFMLSKENLGKTSIEVPFIAPDGITYRIQFFIISK